MRCELRTLAVATALVLGLAACGDDDGTPTPDAGADASVPDAGADAAVDAAPDAGGPTVDWTPCPLYPDGSSSRMAECALVDVPLRYQQPEGDTLPVWIQRLRGTATEKKGQVWFLQGGPGGSGTVFAAVFDEYSALDPRWDYYVLEHRGVGLSQRLGCPDQEALQSEGGFGITASEIDGCLASLQSTWGDDLTAFSTTEAAHDLGVVVDRVREPGLDVFVYGVSYGTYWVLRYLHLFPDQATGIILDSIAPPGLDFSVWDVDFDAIGQDFMAYCATDPVCSAKLGADPWAYLEQVYDDVAQGSCPAFTAMVGAGAERANLRVTAGSLLMSMWLRPFIPALAYRLARCDADDVAALQHLGAVLYGDPEPDAVEQLESGLLGNNVALSEMWPDPHPDASALAATTDGLLMATGAAVSFAAWQDVWPAYPEDAFVDQWPTTALPVLMLAGDLDPQTPPRLTEQALDHLTGPNQRFYMLPRCAHGLLWQSPTTSGSFTCGAQLFFQFLEDPTATPLDSCVDQIQPVDFTGDPGYSQYLLGTDDMWENGVTPPRPPGAPAVVPVEPPDLQRVRRELRRRLRGLTLR